MSSATPYVSLQDMNKNSRRKVQKDGIYYICGNFICIKVHFYSDDPYIDIRKYHVSDIDHEILTAWKPEDMVDGKIPRAVL